MAARESRAATGLTAREQRATRAMLAIIVL